MKSLKAIGNLEKHVETLEKPLKNLKSLLNNFKRICQPLNLWRLIHNIPTNSSQRVRPNNVRLKSSNSTAAGKVSWNFSVEQMMFGEAFGPKAFSSNDVLDPQHPNQIVTKLANEKRSTEKFQLRCRRARQLELFRRVAFVWGSVPPNRLPTKSS